MNCSEHGTEMFYSAWHDLYACVDVDCRYGHGVTSEELQRLSLPRDAPSSVRELFADPEEHA